MEKVDMLVIGGCAAGMSAAAAARREDENLSIKVLEKGKYISYGSCAIPHYIEGVIPSWKHLVHHTPEEFKKQRNIDVLIHAEATKVDPETKQVTYLCDGKEEIIEYKKLLIATGGTPIDPFKAEDKYDNLFVCRNVEHAKQIRQAIENKKDKKAIVLGSGYIGLEVAVAFKEMGLEVEIFERSDRVLSTFMEDISKDVLEYLVEKGIKINLNEGVTGFKGDGRVKKVVTEKAEYDADLVLLAIGARPATKFLEGSGVQLGKYGEVLITRSMQTNIRDIWSAGDCAATYNAFTGEQTYFPLAQTANRQGKIAGINIASDRDMVLPGVVKTQAMKLFDLEIGSVGFTVDEAKKAGFSPKVVVINSFTKAYKELGGGKIKISLIFDEKTSLILGAQLIGAEGTGLRVNFFTIAIFNKMRIDEFWNMDLVYVPPVAPVYDATLIAARQAMNKLGL